MRHRFEDAGRTLVDFMDEILVVCPTCGGCAIRSKRASTRETWYQPLRLACTRCGYAKDWRPRGRRSQGDDPADPFFNCALWLEAPCVGKTLWAYNRAHLDFMETFVNATHRTRTRDLKTGWTNQSLASRLPRWVKSAKNRAAILRSIAKLREKLPPG